MEDLNTNVKFINTGVSKLTCRDNEQNEIKSAIPRKRKKQIPSKFISKHLYMGINTENTNSPPKSSRNNYPKRKRCNKAMKKSWFDDFEELRMMIDQIQEQYKKKVVNNMNNSNKAWSTNCASSTIATLNSSKLEQSILGFLSKSRDSFPKLYNTLSNVWQGASVRLPENYYNPVVDDNKFEKIASLNSGKQLVRQFITRIHNNIMKWSSELAEDVLIKTLQSLEKDYEMEFEDEQRPIYLQDNLPLAITDVWMEYDDTKYIETNSNGSVEELTNFTSLN